MALPSLHRALYAYLSLYAPLQALIHTRLYPSVAPSSAVLPYVTVQRLGVGSHYHMQGVSATFDTAVQVDCWALQAGEAKRVAETIRGALDAYSGTMDDLDIDGVFVEAEVDLAEFAEDGSERVYHRVSLTLTVWHERGLPAWS